MAIGIACAGCGQAFVPEVVQAEFDGLCPGCLARFASAPVEAPDAPVAPGDFFGDFEILEVLGSGGMGVVFRATQARLGRQVAIKFLHPILVEDPAFLHRFEREAVALAAFDHPNIVRIHDFGLRDGQAWLVLELVEGTSLRDALRSGSVDPLAVVPQICEALQYAHARGVVHRDIKPENILIDRSGRVKIADFGLAKILGTAGQEALTQTRVRMGTPQYMAPEQIECPATVDHRADLYSLGVVLYEMLTGELPLGRFERPSQRACLDLRLDDVVLRALEKQVEKRYQHAVDMQRDLRRASRPPLVHPSLWTPLAAALGGLAALLLALDVRAVLATRRAGLAVEAARSAAAAEAEAAGLRVAGDVDLERVRREMADLGDAAADRPRTAPSAIAVADEVWSLLHQAGSASWQDFEIHELRIEDGALRFHGRVDTPEDRARLIQAIEGSSWFGPARWLSVYESTTPAWFHVEFPIVEEGVR